MVNNWKVFENEIELIRNKKLQEFVKKAFERAYPTFFTNGASRGHHHMEKEGLVRHTKEAVYLAHEKARQYQRDEHYEDLLITAVLLHDLEKYITDPDEGRFNYRIHPLTVRIALYDLVDIIGEEDFNIIMSGIESHMGPWFKHCRVPISEFEYDVYDCDYFSSRINIRIPILGEDIALSRQKREKVEVIGKWRTEFDIPEHIKKGDYIGDILHNAKCKECNNMYFTIIHESIGLCPDCEINARKG